MTLYWKIWWRLYYSNLLERFCWAYETGPGKWKCFFALDYDDAQRKFPDKYVTHRDLMS